MKKKQYYYPPRLELTSVKAETGFMKSSVFEEPENTKDLIINDQDVQDTGDRFDFSNDDTWNY